MSTTGHRVQVTEAPISIHARRIYTTCSWQELEFVDAGGACREVDRLERADREARDTVERERYCDKTLDANIQP